MMKKAGVIGLGFAFMLSAAELRLGESSFDWKIDIAGFMQGGAEMDVNVLSLEHMHDSFGDSKWYYSYDIDLYSSDFVDRMTTLAAYPLTYRFPLVGSIGDAAGEYTMLPVPSEYKIRGLDLNFALGYDLWKREGIVLSAGINTGFSMPVMKIRNLKKSAQMTYKLLEKTDTKIKTWKLGPQLQANIPISRDLDFTSTLSFGLQTGSMENGWFRSSIDIDGSYQVWDLNLRYTPLHTRKDFGWITLEPKLYLSAGYRYKKWKMDEVKVDMVDILEVSTTGMMKMEMTDSLFYLGVGYDF